MWADGGGLPYTLTIYLNEVCVIYSQVVWNQKTQNSLGSLLTRLL